jgi:hypothetical protein
MGCLDQISRPTAANRPQRRMVPTKRMATRAGAKWLQPERKPRRRAPALTEWTWAEWLGEEPDEEPLEAANDNDEVCE